MTGQTAMVIDVSEKLAAALPVYLVLVVGLALVLLLLVFRSIVVPIKATLGFLLAVGVSFGAVVAVYQWGWLGFLFGVDTPAPNHLVPAHPAHRCPLRTRDGLRGLPRRRHAGVVRARR